MYMDSRAALKDVAGPGNLSAWILKPRWKQKNGHWAHSKQLELHLST